MPEFLDKFKREKRREEPRFSYSKEELEAMRQEIVSRTIKDMFGRGTILFLPKFFLSIALTGETHPDVKQVLLYPRVLKTDYLEQRRKKTKVS